MMMEKQERIEKAVIDRGGELPPVGMPPKSGYWYSAGILYKDGVVVCTKPEFMEARKRLENKPKKWEGDFLCQSSDGVWRSFNTEEPEASNTTGIWHSQYGACHQYGKGHVFGDWRQSLEPRPQPDNKEGEGVEWDGDLPPIGIECELQYGIATQGRGYVKFYGSDYCVIQNTTDGEEREQIGKIEDYNFKPISIRSRRDKVIEAAHGVLYQDEDGICRRVSLNGLERLYEEGMLKLPGEEE